MLPRVRAAALALRQAKRDGTALALFDDEVESMSLFDPLTGAIRQKLARVT